MSASEVQTEIVQKVAKWKEVFKREIEVMTGKKIEGDENSMSYVDILNQTKDTGFSVQQFSSIVSGAFYEVGAFGPAATQQLNTKEYKEAKSFGKDLITACDFLMEGPVIEPSMENGDKRLAAIFHYPSYPVVEIFFETDDETQTALPDVFVMNGPYICTVKAIRNLEDNPVLKTRIEQLPQGPR